MKEQHSKESKKESAPQYSTPTWNIVREYGDLCSSEEMVRILIRKRMELSENAMTTSL